jgi:hypothetical protein
MRLSAKAPIVIRGEEITHLDADGYKHLPRATALPDGKVLATSGGKWAPSDLSGISVSSVFGRTGAVVAQTGDYTATQVGAEPYAGVPAQTSFWRSTAAGVRAWVQLVAADITDLATTLAAYLTKANPEFTGTLKQGGTTRITSDGGAWFASMQSANLVGAGDRPVAADLTGTLRPKTPDQFRNMISALSATLKGAANGVAELGADGRVPSGQLPSYVDDVLEYATFSAFPATGETGKIYVNLDQNKTWRWSGSAYVEISASLALGETSATAYRGDRGKTAYDHSQATGNPHGTVPSDIGAARAPATYELSGNTGIGTITASAIKVLVDGATISLSLGANGQAWDVICPDYAVEFYVPTGAKLYRYSGITTGPATYSPGGGRAIRVVRVDATTWLMPNLS